MRLDYFLESRADTCGRATRAAYAAYIADLRRFLETRPGDDPFAPATIRAYLVGAKARGLSDASIDNRYRLIKTCCRWLIEEELLDRDPFVGKGRVRPLPKTRKRRRIYSEAEVVALLKAASLAPAAGSGRHRWAADGPTVRESAQAMALVLLLVDSAMRAGEVCALSCHQVRADMLQIGRAHV
jgi:integrase